MLSDWSFMVSCASLRSWVIVRWLFVAHSAVLERELASHPFLSRQSSDTGSVAKFIPTWP